MPSEYEKWRAEHPVPEHIHKIIEENTRNPPRREPLPFDKTVCGSWIGLDQAPERRWCVDVVMAGDCHVTYRVADPPGCTAEGFTAASVQDAFDEVVARLRAELTEDHGCELYRVSWGLWKRMRHRETPAAVFVRIPMPHAIHASGEVVMR